MGRVFTTGKCAFDLHQQQYRYDEANQIHTFFVNSKRKAITLW